MSTAASQEGPKEEEGKGVGESVGRGTDTVADADTGVDADAVADKVTCPNKGADAGAEEFASAILVPHVIAMSGASGPTWARLSGRRKGKDGLTNQ